MTWTKTTLRCLPLSLFALAACATDPGDVGSGPDDGGDTSASDTMPTGSTVQPTDPTGTDPGTEGSASTGTASETATQSTSAGSSSDATDDGSETTSEDASSDGSGGTTTGAPVTDCSECGPDEGCVVESAFVTETFCVPWPQACGAEFDCACAGEYCEDPFTVCLDFPDPPQRAIRCECPAC